MQYLHLNHLKYLPLAIFLSGVTLPPLLPLHAASPEETLSIFSKEPEELHILDFTTALDSVYQNSPELKVADYEIEITQAIKEQASLLPNPEFECDVDDFGGSRTYSRFNNADVTCTVTQLIELGGKRGARCSVADQQQKIAEWNREVIQLNLKHRLTEAFIDTFVKQEAVKISLEQKSTSQKIVDTVQAKVEAGKVPITQQHKAEITLAKCTHETDHALRAFLAAKHQLVALWVSSCLDFELISYPFYDLMTPPPLCELLQTLDENPELIKLDLQVEEAEENYRLQRSNRVPDLLVSAGVVNYRDTNDTAMTMGVVIPIPLFNRNQGNIKAGEYQICLLETQKEALRHELEMQLSSSYEEWLCAYQEAISLRDHVLNKATSTFECINEGYSTGKYEFLELLDAQQTQSEILENYIDAVAQYHLLKTQVERLINRSVY